MKIAVYCHSIAPSIDGVCRRFTGLMTELIRLGHEIVLFTLEETPLELPPMLKEVITVDHMCFPAYPGKKVARPNLSCFLTIMNGIRKHKPDVIHVTCDGLTQMFIFAGLTLGIPVVGSFHTYISKMLCINKRIY